MQLWKMIAEVGTPAVLIDCDLRNSEIRRKYGVRILRNEKLVGVPHYLAGQAEIEDVIYKTNVPNGYMIPVTSAIANPTILLESPHFAKMLEYCAEHFAYVLVDTPPLGSVADALNIARHCDGSVLVVHGGETPRKMVLNSVQQLKRTDTPLLGVVLNRATWIVSRTCITTDTTSPVITIKTMGTIAKPKSNGGFRHEKASSFCRCSRGSGRISDRARMGSCCKPLRRR